MQILKVRALPMKVRALPVKDQPRY